LDQELAGLAARLDALEALQAADAVAAKKALELGEERRSEARFAARRDIEARIVALEAEAAGLRGTLEGRHVEAPRRPLVQQIVPAVRYHDAVTHQALALDQLMQDAGWRSELYAEFVHPDLADQALRYERRRERPDLVLVHYSIWSDAIEDVLRRRPSRLAVIFHNVTPPEWLREVAPEVAELCHQGQERLGEVVRHADLVIVDSEYDGRAVRACAGPEPLVIPLLMDLPLPRPPGPPVGVVILHVGRIVPNKRIDVLIRAVALLQRGRLPEARLVLVGSAESFEPYGEALGRLAADIGASVEFRGLVGDDERDRLYREASAYCCVSAHEGFCVPLAEAMAAGAPVIAVADSAVPETVGEGGLLLPEADPRLVAECLAVVLSTPAVAQRLSAAGLARASKFRRDVVAPRYVEAIQGLLARRA
jgi:glycosyltransferase involved in cell wall biosynthesis